MTDQPNDLQLPDPTDIDWDAELEGLPREQILIEYAHRRVIRLVDQWYDLRAGDAIGFGDMPAELQLDPDARIVDGFSPGIMPRGFGDRLSEEEVEAIILYIETIK